MHKLYIDNEGTKVAAGVFTSLVDATEEYMLHLESDSNKREKIENLTPSEGEVRKAEIDLQVLTLLQEVNLI